MYGVFLSGCLRQRWSQCCLHCWTRWIHTPPPLSTLHALCLLQYWFSTPSLIPCRIISAFQNQESLWAIASGTCPERLFYGEVRFLGSALWIFQPIRLSLEVRVRISGPTKVLKHHAAFVTAALPYMPNHKWVFKLKASIWFPIYQMDTVH